MENQQTDNLQNSDAPIGSVSDSATADSIAPSQTAIADPPATPETSANVDLAPAPAETATQVPTSAPASLDAPVAPPETPIPDAPAVASPPPVSSPLKGEEKIGDAPVVSTEIPKLDESATLSIPPSPVVTSQTPKSVESAPAIPIITALLIKARAAIQSRKQKKLLKILALIGQKGKVKNADVSRILRCSNATATRYLDELEKQGKVRQVGKRAGSFYELIR